ncbi:adenylosuccinate synthetase [Parafrankia sp. FMc2]|uniref:adenylosuccinate synthetase n=1 Tax=Parafrankia sp. FMc2 TaxID=3233196 RepID=UPI0034D6D9FD
MTWPDGDGDGPGDHVIVTDLGFGDAGKGTVVDWLCARAADAGRVPSVVRFNGGAQAAHNVVTDDGRHHTFAQFGAGSFTAGCATHLARTVLVDPFALVAEAVHLESVGVPDPFGRLTVDGDALLTTPYHAVVNQARELARGAGAHGSCGMGIGETVSYAQTRPDIAPRVADCAGANPSRLRRRLHELRDWTHAELTGLSRPAGPGAPAELPAVPEVEDVVAVLRAFGQAARIVDGSWLRVLCARGPVVFEGAQGVLLDEWHGFHPYTTWSTTTAANAEELLAQVGLRGAARRLGVVRCYTTRHGPGPLVTEDAELAAVLPDVHNGTGRWQGRFRVGHFDAVAHRYAVDAAGGVDAVALTHLDVAARLPLRLAFCAGYRIDGECVRRLEPGPPGDLERQAALTERLARAEPLPGVRVAPEEWPDRVAAALGAPVTLTSYGPRAADKMFLPAGRGTAAPAAGPGGRHARLVTTGP